MQGELKMTKRQSRIKRLWGFGFLFFLCFALGYFLCYESQMPKIDKVVPCYDRFGSEIINQICIEQVANNPNAKIYILGSIVCLLITGFFEIGFINALLEKV